MHTSELTFVWYVYHTTSYDNRAHAQEERDAEGDVESKVKALRSENGHTIFRIIKSFKKSKL